MAKKKDIQVEILGFDAKVHYSRPADHKDVLEALRTPGYAIRGHKDGLMVVWHIIMSQDRKYNFPVKLNNTRFLAGPIDCDPLLEEEFYDRLREVNGGELVV